MIRTHRWLLLFPMIGLLCSSAGAQAPPIANPDDLWAQTTLYRDAWGVPHVYADTPRALAFAFGYAQAEDKLPTLALAYRVAQGRAAEVFGERYANWDAFSLKAGHQRIAEHALPQMDGLTQALCAGFALGVNAWIAEHPDEVAPWVEAITPADVLALWHCVMVSMAPFDLPSVFRPPPALESGSAWAIAANRMEEGKAALVINPHMHYEGPFQWYEAHLVSGDLNVAGVTLAGLPVIMQGHNASLGWALTPNGADSADVYHKVVHAAQRNPNDPRPPDPREAQAPILEYLSHAQRYFVKTAAGMDERFVPVLDDPLGPIFEGPDNQLYAWHVGGYLHLAGFVQLIQMARAQDLASFQEVLAMQQLPPSHVTYADKAGNLFYLYNAITGTRAIPEKGFESDPNPPLRQFDWRQPIDAMWAQEAWREIVPITELPYVVNPEAGFIQACGNPPWTVSDARPLDPSVWPGWFVSDIDTWRAQRVRQLLRTGKRSFRDMQSMVYDAVLPAAVELAPRLLQWADAREGAAAQAHPDLPSALNLLRGWNHLADTQSPAMTFYHVWWSAMQTQNAGAVATEADLYNALLTESAEAPQRALRAAADAVRMMRNEYETVELPWGEVHRVRRGDREEALGGAGTGDPIFHASDSLYQDGKWWATYGTGYAMAVQFGDTPESVSVHLFGASDDAESPHFDDQLDLILDKRFKYLDFAREDVWRYSERALGRRLGFYPEGTSAELLLMAAEPVWAEVASEVEAPALLPAGLVTYTVFMAPSWQPGTTPARSHLRVYVPPELCHAEDLHLLSLYGWTEASGWTPLDDQAFDTETQLFTGSGDGAVTFAVLGPPEPRDRAGEAAAPPTPVEPAPGVAAAPEIEPGEDEEAGTFHFERLDRPEEDQALPIGDAAPVDEDRKFKFERLDTGESASAPAPAGSSTPPEFTGRPIGKRQFKMIIHGQESDASDEAAAEKPVEEEADDGAASAPPAAEAAPEAAPEAATEATTEAAEEPIGAGPAGKKQFKFKRLD